MARTVGGLIGNLPGVAVVGATVLIGAVLGALGGVLGQQARRLWTADRGFFEK
jgi:ABC-type dipeptide/oligopeptide/nickel transport system permease subunit